jgi:tRNA threonylcarbamoyladenosine biosynthesis protein TsaE
MMHKEILIESLELISLSVRDLIAYTGIEKPGKKPNCLAFYGEMGAGKTTIIKEICHILKVKDITSSPSFSLINQYVTDSGRTIFHFDFYRINRKEEVFDLGYEEYFFGDSLCLIEWPEKIETLLPEFHYRIDIELLDKRQRLLKIKLVR